MAKPKVLIFSTAYFPYVGGAEVAVKELTDRLIDYDFDLITARFDRRLPVEEVVGRVRVFRVGSGSPFWDKFFLPWRGTSLVLKLHRDNNYRAFWCVMATFASGAAYLANIFGRLKVPIILNLQEGDSETHFARRWLGLINVSWWLALKQSRVVTVLSIYLSSRAKRWGYRGEPVIIPNGVDLEKFQPAEIDLAKKVIITTSRLVLKNGVGDLIEAMPLLPRQVSLQIYGTGSLQQALEQQVKQLDLTDRVKFFGHVAPDDLPAKLAQASVFCRPSLSEGQGISFLEAMAIGLPTVGTAVGGIVDFIKEGETGWLAEPSNPQSIAKKIAFILDPAHKDEVLAVAKKGQVLVRRNYSWDDLAGKMNQILAGLTS